MERIYYVEGGGMWCHVVFDLFFSIFPFFDWERNMVVGHEAGGETFMIAMYM